MTPDLPLWADLILGAATLLVALHTIWRYVLPAVRGIWRGTVAAVHAVRAVKEFIDDWRETGGFIALVAKITHLTLEVDSVKRELFPNGGGSMRDSLTRTEHATVELGRRLSEVDAKATALGERQESLRRADESTAADLRQFLEREYRDTQEANAHLRASLNEVLAIGDDDG